MNSAGITAIIKSVDVLRQGVTVSDVDERLVHELRDMLKISDEAILRRRQKLFLKALQFDKMDNRFHSVVKAHEETFTWLFDKSMPVEESRKTSENEDRYRQYQARDRFVSWLEEEYLVSKRGVFHIRDHPGAGKNTLMKYIYRHEKTKEHLMKWAGERDLVLGSFFFWKPGEDMEKNQHGLIRALTYHILAAAPDLLPIAFANRWTAERNDDDLARLQPDEIEEAFGTLIKAPQTYHQHCFVFFLDGLDEFEDTTNNETTKHLVSLVLDWIKYSRGGLKIIVSSRPWPEFELGLQGAVGLIIQELTCSDIEVDKPFLLLPPNHFELSLITVLGGLLLRLNREHAHSSLPTSGLHIHEFIFNTNPTHSRDYSNF